MSLITPVSFINEDGFQLFGMLEKPPADIDCSKAIILLSPGIKMRVAPHRLYNKMSNYYASLGFSVLRFDFYGLGDAGGDVEEEFLADLYGSIQVGRYVSDTLIAIDWLSKKCGTSDIIIAGLCGGAITGLLAAQSDDRVKGLIALGIPVVLDSSSTDAAKYITSGQMDRLHKGYIRRLLSVKSWLRLLTFQSDYRIIFNIFKNKFNKVFSKTSVDQSEVSASSAAPDNSNPLFAPAFFNMLEKGNRILLVFSGTDRLKWEFDEKFKKRFSHQLEKYTNLVDEVEIKEANHIISMPEWQQEMFSTSEFWLNSNFIKHE